jgi:acyl-coenzyme A thioesterase PaaI-like protein
LRPAVPGRITGTGRVVHRGGSIAFLAGELRDDEGEVLATATATARIIRPSRDQMWREK